jgi:hypothetical protein
LSCLHGRCALGQVTQADINKLAAKQMRAKLSGDIATANALAEESTAIAARASSVAADAEADLAAAIPAVQRAMAALDSLDKKELGECKTMVKPPPGVDDVFAADVVLLAGVSTSVRGVVRRRRHASTSSALSVASSAIPRAASISPVYESPYRKSLPRPPTITSARSRSGRRVRSTWARTSATGRKNSRIPGGHGSTTPP